MWLSWDSGETFYVICVSYRQTQTYIDVCIYVWLKKQLYITKSIYWKCARHGARHSPAMPQSRDAHVGGNYSEN